VRKFPRSLAAKLIQIVTKDYLSSAIQWSFTSAINSYYNSKPQVHIVQLGANDGSTIDPIHDIVKKDKSVSTLVEAVPYVYDRLKQTYLSYSNITTVNKVIVTDENATEVAFYYMDAGPGMNLPDYYSWWGSLNRDHLEKFRSLVGQEFDSILKKQMLPAITLNTLYKQTRYKKIDILQVDIEGLDAEILNSFDLQNVQPDIIMFEHVHSPVLEVETLDNTLKKLDYHRFKKANDSIYVKPPYLKHYRFVRVCSFLMPQRTLETS